MTVEIQNGWLNNHINIRTTRKTDLRKALRSLKEYFNDRNLCPIGINFEVPEEVFARFLDDSKKLDDFFDE